MTTHITPRQPFAALDSPRLQSLSNVKNRQNALSANISSPLKSTQSGPTKRRAPSTFDDEADSENIDPSIFNSPTKRSKTSDGLSKPSQFCLTTSQSARTSPAMPSSTRISTTPASMPSVRTALASPISTTSTPISMSRGSPKHKRVGILSKRRTSGSPFRRVDPPTFSRNTSPAGLPFSIDAALSGTISTYTPKTSSLAPIAVPTLEESMPKSWFFDIHEDTPEQEATNLMEHSACTLDISSDDDCDTKRKNDELERGKENIPPPDFLATLATPTANISAIEVSETVPFAEAAPAEHVKLPKLKRALAQDEMDQDRSPLSDLPAADYYGPGLDASSYVTVDAVSENPSGLSKEFDFTVPTPPREEVPLKEEMVENTEPKEEIPIFSDETATSEVPVEPQENAPVFSEIATETIEPGIEAPL